MHQGTALMHQETFPKGKARFVAVNTLLSSSADDSSKCPEYKVSAVRVESIQRDELDPEDEVELSRMRRQLIL